MKVVSTFLLWSLLFHNSYAAEHNIISDSRFLTNGDTLVSNTGIFELGYFELGSPENRYLGIRYKKISVTTLVWVANREEPLASSSTFVLKVTDQGTLVLFSNTSVIWSSNTTIKSLNATAKLHDTGNLVLMDQHETVLWQSFDYPTEHWLPGMKLGVDYARGLEWRLSSWKAGQQPVVGEFTWAAGTQRYTDFKLKQGSVVRFRWELWRNQRLKGLSQFSRNWTFTYDIIINEREVSFAYNIENSSSLFRITLSSYGKYESWGWVEDSNNWQLGASFPKDLCDTYNICNAYGNCVSSLTDQTCACLDDTKFVPRNKKRWQKGDWSGGCVRRTPLDCKNGTETFIRYSHVKLPDAQNNSWFNMSMNVKECEERCLENCTCMAYANPDPTLGGRGCLLWFGELIDIRQYPEGKGSRDIFVRMATSKLGNYFEQKYIIFALLFHAFKLPPLTVAQSNSTKRGSNIKIILPVLFTGVLLVGFITSWLWYARKNNNNSENIDEGVISSVSRRCEDPMELPLFTFSIIANSTAHFSLHNKVGEGGFGSVYKGVLEDGQQVAVKRLSKSSSQGLDEFKNEVMCVSKLQHRNLVKLLGCCIHGHEKLLIYEYMSNKSLDLFFLIKQKH